MMHLNFCFLNQFWRLMFRFRTKKMHRQLTLIVDANLLHIFGFSLSENSKYQIVSICIFTLCLSDFTVGLINFYSLFLYFYRWFINFTLYG